MKHRLFLAIDVPSSPIIELQSRLEKLGLPISWEKPEKLHLTLNFIGRVSSDQLGGVSRVIKSAIYQFNKLTVSLPFLETLYQRHDQTLLYLAASSPDLVPLQKAVCAGLDSIKFPQPRRFLPHVTIGKLKRTDPTTTKHVIDIISDFDYQPVSSFEVDHLTLYESLLSSKGSTYQKIANFRLSTP